jgi:hypothetical protein
LIFINCSTSVEILLILSYLPVWAIDGMIVGAIDGTIVGTVLFEVGSFDSRFSSPHKVAAKIPAPPNMAMAMNTLKPVENAMVFRVQRAR